MNETNKMRPIHPGEVLREEFLITVVICKKPELVG